MSDPSRVEVSGPLVGYVAGFAEELVGQGYRPTAVCGQLQLVAHVSRWLAGREASVEELTPALVEEYVACRRSQGYTQRRSARALKPLLEHLGRLGVLPGALGGPQARRGGLVEDYRNYLVSARGLAPSTVTRYVSVARAFLNSVAGHVGDADLGCLAARQAIEFVAGESRRLSPGSAKDLVVCLRSFLRFVYTSGLSPFDLSGVLPAVAVWGGGQLPKALPAEQVGALLGSCERASLTGLRDLAVLKLLCRLGLRAGEVAGLVLGDFDWSHGEVVVTGKGRRVDRMPVPVDVGEAIVEYLCQRRPQVACRSVFLRVCAPIVGLGPVGVSGVVMRACERAGVPPCGAHRLRHSAATAMLRGGGSLSDVGQVLRHRSGAATTSIYARVDLASLRSVAQPWPGGVA
ncbi:MAG: tyrosine-type recombinase/integrase [Actinomycetota bacterium]|nr:tyrosine-type recombinase/integrase [Actinomycetota bacterium]